MTLSLRPYQRAAIDALFAYWRAGKGNGLLVLPTGAGKSLVLAALAQELLRDYPTLRIGIVTHVRELISQNYQELLRLWPQAPAGIYSAGIGRRDTRAQILFCGIQSVWNKTDLLGEFDLLMVDEAHLIPPSAETTYGRFISRLKEATPDIRIVGLTATPYRLGTGLLHRGKGRIFDDIVYDANVGDLIEDGYLSPLISKATAQQLDVSGVQKRGGEYVAGALEIAVDKEWITKAAVDEIVKFGADRKAWLVFCAGATHCEHVRDAFRALGISCEMVTHHTPKGERDSIVQRYKQRLIKCLISVNIFSTGSNFPFVDLLALLRPSESPSLYSQQIGRGLRTIYALGFNLLTKEGRLSAIAAGPKPNCLVLDFAGLIKKHGPIDTITVNSATKAKDPNAENEVRAKECPICATLVALNTRQCPTCAHQWPIPDAPPKHEATADAVSAIVSKGAPAWIAVDAVRFYTHRKDGSPDSLRVEYSCGFVVHKEYLGFQHQGLMRQKAERFWASAAAQPIPRTTAEALARQKEIKQPTAIMVRPEGKFFAVVGRRFDEPQQQQQAAE